MVRNMDYNEEPKKIYLDKPAFLSTRQWEYALALKNRGGSRVLAAYDLGVKEHAVENMISVIRKKVKSARSFNRSYRLIMMHPKKR